MTANRVWTKEEIRDKILTSYEWLSRSLTALYALQTREEQIIGETREHNGVGFNAIDAEFLSSLARQILAGRRLSDRQLYFARPKLVKYCAQLARIANQQAEEMQAELPAVPAPSVCGICGGPLDIERNCLDVDCVNYNWEAESEEISIIEAEAEIESDEDFAPQIEMVKVDRNSFWVRAEDLGLEQYMHPDSEPEEIMINGMECGLIERILNTRGMVKELIFQSTNHKTIQVVF